MNMFLIAGAALAAFMLLTTAADADDPPDADRVRELAAMLPADPVGLGQPIADRKAWDELAASGVFDAVVRKAEALLDQPIPDQPDELYLEFSRTGNRTNWQRVMGLRRGRIAPLVIAECLENDGRFVPAIEEIVRMLCAERTWVFPAHDRDLTDFNGESISIDLASSALGWHLASADWLVGERLDGEVRELLRAKVRERILAPYRRMFTGEEPANWWTRTTSNWNAVCLAGVTGAGLALLSDAGERAEFVAASERYSRNFLRGFTPDGYCSEGLGYWNYGFGHYVLLSEIIRQATDGGVDLLARPEARAPATFGARIGIISDVYPAFADCGVASKPSVSSMYFINRVLGLGLDRYDDLPTGSIPSSLGEAMLFAFPNAASRTEPVAQASAGPGLRDWFSDAGILIGRPAPEQDCVLGVALKGGHNAEHHNHNDVGSYVVVTGARAVLLDPGGEVYTARTFSSRRYESKLLNSFGHPVPVVAGKLQMGGKDARAAVLAADFTDEADTLSLDIAAAYDVPELEELTRTFVYSREGAGSLTVTDQVKFAEPASFETVLIHQGEWVILDSGDLLIYDHGGAVQARVTSEGADLEIVAEQIDEDAQVHPTRLAIRLTKPVTEASVEVAITPSAGPDEDERVGLLLNGGFEYGQWGWLFPNGSQGSVSTERAATGEASLKIADADPKRGSNVSSAPMAVSGAGEYVLRGRAYHVSGEGVGMYIRLLNRDGRMVNEMDERGWISPVGSLEGPVGEWVDFEFPFATSDETASIQLWIHSYTSATVEANLDDLVITPLTDE